MSEEGITVNRRVEVVRREVFFILEVHRAITYRVYEKAYGEKCLLKGGKILCNFLKEFSLMILMS